MKNILVVEDDSKIQRIYMQFLDLLATVDFASSGQQGLDMASEKDYQLVITDLSMPGMNGAEMVAALHEKKPELKFLVVSAFSKMHDFHETLKEIPTVIDIIQKPFEGKEIRKLVMTALK